MHPSERLEKKSTATSKILPDATEEAAMDEGGKDDYMHVVATLQKGIANMKHLTSQSLSKLQDGVEEGLGQAEDDLKNAKGELWKPGKPS